MELSGKFGDRSVRAPQLLQNAAPGGIRQGCERHIEAGWTILNHIVQFLAHRFAPRKGCCALALPTSLAADVFTFLPGTAIQMRSFAEEKMHAHGGGLMHQMVFPL